MSCKHLEGKVGDKGQRYEIRFYAAIRDEKEPGIDVVTKGEINVFGWAATLKGARRMMDGLRLAPWAVAPWIVDRKALTVRRMRELLAAVEDPETIFAGLGLGEDPCETYDNAAGIDRLPDGRIVLV